MYTYLILFIQLLESRPYRVPKKLKMKSIFTLFKIGFTPFPFLFRPLSMKGEGWWGEKYAYYALVESITSSCTIPKATTTTTTQFHLIFNYAPSIRQNYNLKIVFAKVIGQCSIACRYCTFCQLMCKMECGIRLFDTVMISHRSHHHPKCMHRLSWNGRSKFA